MPSCLMLPATCEPVLSECFELLQVLDTWMFFQDVEHVLTTTKIFPCAVIARESLDPPNYTAGPRKSSSGAPYIVRSDNRRIFQVEKITIFQIRADLVGSASIMPTKPGHKRSRIVSTLKLSRIPSFYCWACIDFARACCLFIRVDSVLNSARPNIFSCGGVRTQLLKFAKRKLHVLKAGHVTPRQRQCNQKDRGCVH